MCGQRDRPGTRPEVQPIVFVYNVSFDCSNYPMYAILNKNKIAANLIIDAPQFIPAANNAQLSKINIMETAALKTVND